LAAVRLVPDLLRFVAVVFAGAALAACATVNMPPVTDVPTGTRLAGKVVWHELLTDQPEASRRFYRELFGWEFEEVGLRMGVFQSVNYTLVRHNGRLIGGMIDTNHLDRDTDVDISQWIVLLSVEDVDQAVATLVEAGGTVFTPPTDLADRGRIAVVADPQGALLSLLQTRDGDPVDAPPAIGDFLWDELWAADVEAATAFYQRLANYDADNRFVEDDEPGVGSSGYRVLSTNDTPRVGILANPVEGLPPLWVTYIRVEDPGAITAKVHALGGQILLDVQDRDIGGRVALIAGPSGEGIALQTWDPDAKVAGNR
jgi:predicted enzyme related to lactoylglutathione lyase